MNVVALRCEHRREADALGIWSRRPRLSWRTETAGRDWAQVAYELEVVDDDTGVVVWTSGRVESDESHLVPWGGRDLAPRERCRWRVRVHGSDGTSAWSDWAAFELGLLDESEVAGSFVVPAAIAPADPAQPVAYLRHEFDLPADVRRARVHATALGVYELELNGARVGDVVLTPGWTSYGHRVRVETFDVTELVQSGRNAIGAMLADGWYGESFGFAGNVRRVYGDEPALLVQLEVVDGDGDVHRVITDDGWRSSIGPIVSSGIYAGETYDARCELDGWSRPGFDDGNWHGTRPYEGHRGALVGRVGPPVRRIEEVAPVTITTSPSGRTILDFGQNLVGRLRIRVSGPAGTQVTIRHAEILEDGELCTRILRAAAATDRYTLRGDGTEEWEPRFTFHGFRYAALSGWPGDLHADDVRAVVCHSELARTGWFECSDERINRLHENIVWGMRGNFLDVPTDCPQRDERLGWTGDIRVFAPTACFLHDVDGFLASWLAELAAEQAPNGGVPFVVPDTMSSAAMVTAVWGDAAVVVPWVLYERYGDRGVLEAQYISMRSFVDAMVTLAGEDMLWDHGFQFGDWVDPAAPPDRPAAARTDPYLVAQAAMCQSLAVLVRAARVLGYDDDVARYAGLAADARAAFAREYTTPNGRLAADAQTAYALAIDGRLVPDGPARAHAGDRLALLAFAEGFRIGTGFVGTPLLCDALCETGHRDVAYALLEQTECPSWLYPVLHGATTVWERWDGLRPDGTLNPGEMNSFNHYALGAVGDWLHRTVAGLAVGAPGYRELDVRIAPGGSLTSAGARHITPYGTASSAWRVADGVLHVDIVVPPSTTATVRLPGRDPIHVGSGSHAWSTPFPGA
ncbi:MAG TPA: family 78 glycoside hydrolase catalytic domain [Acidimicrobiia bacterium]|nr:family 78 glycoside hydrolase catalytic domain [Acidimicrobiia bacterium]